jgi:Glycosyltransferase family 92
MHICVANDHHAFPVISCTPHACALLLTLTIVSLLHSFRSPVEQIKSTLRKDVEDRDKQFTHQEVFCFFHWLPMSHEQRGDTLVVNNEHVLPIYYFPDHRYVYNPPLSVCVPTLYSEANQAWLSDWLTYYVERLGATYVFIYVDSLVVWRHSLAMLHQHPHAGRLHIIRMCDDEVAPSHYHHQKVTMADCTLRNKVLNTEWVLYQDLDELLLWPPPMPLFHLAMPSKVDTVSFGSRLAHSACCVPLPGPLYERTRVVEEEFAGGDCAVSWLGHRKYALRVAKSTLLMPRYIHLANDPNRLSMRSLQINPASGVYLLHARGAHVLDTPLCIHNHTAPECAAYQVADLWKKPTAAQSCRANSDDLPGFWPVLWDGKLRNH